MGLHNCLENERERTGYLEQEGVRECNRTVGEALVEFTD